MNQVEKSRSFYTCLVKISVLLRILLGPVIFLFPVFVSIATLIIDAFDGELYKRAGYARPRYSLYDKLLDYYWYVFVVIYIVVNNVPFKPVFIALFFFRSLGQIIFFFTKNGLFLFLFPNIFEKFFFYYLITLIFPNAASVLLHPPFIYLAFVALTVFSFILEIVIHLKQMNFSGFYLGKTSYWPVVTINKYRVLILFSLLMVVYLSFSYLDFKNHPLLYKSQAGQTSGKGSVVTYDRKGTLTGWLQDTTDDSYRILLFTEKNSTRPVCEKTVNLSILTPSRRLFIYKDNCLADLSDRSYYLFLIPKNKQNPSYELEFVINNGRLL